MSLINDALKKAARQRAEAELAAPMPGGGGYQKKGPTSAQLMIFVAAGAIPLVIVSVVATSIFLSRKSEVRPVAALAAPRPTASPSRAVPVQAALVISVPQIAPTAPVVRLPPSVAPAPTPQQSKAVAAQAPAAPAPAPASGDRVQGFLDALHVSGVRSAGSDSKALVDGHVYKVNDILDRALGLKLEKVEPDKLTFVDATGATYVKSF